MRQRSAPWSCARPRPIGATPCISSTCCATIASPVWVPDPATRDLRALLTHRMRLVRIRTMVKNGLHAIALNYRLARGSKLLRQAGLVQLHALALPPHTAQRRDQSLELLAGLTTQIRTLDDAITTAALAHPDGRRAGDGPA